jgi:5'-3' exonuclease
MSHVGSSPTTEVSEDLIRHIVLSSILYYKKKFSGEFGNVVLCVDDKDYWRKEIFPYYKAGRKKARDDSKYDWKVIFTLLNKIREELKEYFPYKVLQVEKAEADDIIAVLSKYSQDNELLENVLVREPRPVLILSADKDFLQLQKYANVKQFSPMQKKFLVTSNPKKVLLEHIIRGDSGDGIPNFLSEDNIFLVEGKKQKSIQSKKLEEWLKCGNPQEFCDEYMLRNFKRNEALIDFDKIPAEIQEKIIYTYENAKLGNTKHLMTYFIRNKLRYLMESIGDF